MRNLSINRTHNSATEQYSYNGLLSAAAPIYIILCFTRFYITDEQYSRYVALTTIGIGLLYLILLFIGKQFGNNARSVISLFFLFGIIEILQNRNDLLEMLPQFISNLGFAWAISSSYLHRSLQSIVLIIVLCTFSLFAISGQSPDEIFTISRNFISVVVILALSFYYFSCEDEKKTPSIILLIWSILAILWGVGRAGILSGLIIVAGTMLYSGRRFIPIAMIVAIFAVALFSSSGDIESSNAFTYGIARFETLSGTSQRSLINDEYTGYALSNFNDFFFGVPLDTVRAVQEVDGNPHNSYISLHIGFGICGFLYFIFLSIVSARRLISNDKNLTLIIMSASIFRSLFDSTAFHGPLDVIIFYCIFKAGMRNPQKLDGY